MAVVKRLFVLIGTPCSGKSTWAQKQIAEHGGNWVSRDLIRFSLLSDRDEYFSKEDAVLNEYYGHINALLVDDTCNGDIFCDATHLNPKARRKFFENINYKLANEIIGVYFDTPLRTCIKRNEKRMGRTRVPKWTIKGMYNRMSFPTLGEEPFNEVWKICEDGTIIKKGL